MVRHLIASKLIDSSEEQKAKVRDIFLSMKGRIPEIIDIEVGTDFLGSERSYDVVLIISVKDRDALKAYINHPYHVNTIVPYIHSVRSASVSVDWEL